MALTKKDIEQLLRQAEKNGYNRNHVLEALKNNKILEDELSKQAQKVLNQPQKNTENVNPMLDILDKHVRKENTPTPFKTTLKPLGF